MQRESLKDRTLGQWPVILQGVGIPTKFLRNKHGPCPMCDGKDRFRFDDKGGRGTWICSQCGAGDGIELVKRFLRLQFREAAVEIERHLGEVAVIRRPDQPANDDRRRGDLEALWSRSRPVTLDDAAGRYLNGRTGITEFPRCLRFSPDERYAGPRSSFHPALVAKVDPSEAGAAAGETAALHRTYLDPLGGKAAVEAPRKMLGTMPPGAAVRLMPHEDVLGIAEGIETAFSAASLFNVPCWAALTAGLLEQWAPPETVTTVIVFGDADHSFTGQSAAFGLARRLRAKGLHVIVELPPLLGQDWNDVHQRRMAAA